jgi:hypothetical protein
VKYLICLTLSLIVVGCATTNQVPVAEYAKETEATLPPITVFRQHPSDEFRERCETFDRDSVLQHCTLNKLDLGKFASELSATGAFEEVLYANREVPYQIRVSTAYYNTEGGDDLASAAFSGATMLLVPLIISADISVDASLYWHEFKLKELQYELPVEFRVSLLSMDQDGDRDVAKSIASYILRDLQTEDLLSAQYLATTLNSSDYFQGLSTPEQAGKYFKQQTIVYNNPLYGAYVSYGRDTLETDYIEVFVYPVRSGHWSDETSTLQKEMENIRKDLDLFNKENSLQSLHVSDNEFVDLPHPNAPVTAIVFSNEVQDTLSNEYVSHNYLMIMQDKFLRIRHTSLRDAAPSEQVQNAVRQLVQESRVPPESLFLAKLRKQWRDSQAL